MKTTESGIVWEVTHCSIDLLNPSDGNLTRDDIIAMAKSLFITGKDLAPDWDKIEPTEFTAEDAHHAITGE